MSISLRDFDSWPEGIPAARIPANNNVRRMEALVNPVLSATTTAQPASPSERDVYILGATHTGTQWATFDEGDLVIFYEATWTAFAPFDGLRKYVVDEGEDWQFVGESSGAWAPAGGGGGGAVSSVNGQTGAVVLDAADIDITDAGGYFTSTDVEGALQELGSAMGGGSTPPPVVTHTTGSLLATGANAGNYTRFTNTAPKTYTFSDAETYVVGAEYHVRNAAVSDLTLTEGGAFVLNAPADGSLVIPPFGTATIKIVDTAEADVIGVTSP